MQEEAVSESARSLARVCITRHPDMSERDLCSVYDSVLATDQLSGTEQLMGESGGTWPVSCRQPYKIPHFECFNKI